jgi:cell wall assembly regulator SMI1
MNSIEDILNEAVRRGTWELSPPKGMPVINEEVDAELILPHDVKEFYTRCGGLIANKDGVCGSWIRIVSPEEFQRIDSVILGGEMFATGPFRNWYAIADVQDGNYLAIDLSKEFNGKCIDSFHETFAMPGYVNVVAASFTDLLLRILNHPEDSAFYLQDDVVSLGEAFTLYGYKPLA